MDRAAKITALENEFLETVEDMKAALSRRDIEGVEDCTIHALTLAKSVCILAGRDDRAASSSFSHSLNSQPSTKD